MGLMHAQHRGLPAAPQARRSKEGSSPGVLRESEATPCFWTPNLQNHGRIHFYFKAAKLVVICHSIARTPVDAKPRLNHFLVTLSKFLKFPASRFSSQGMGGWRN